jgi:hypothetical protein
MLVEYCLSRDCVALMSGRWIDSSWWGSPPLLFLSSQKHMERSPPLLNAFRSESRFRNKKKTAKTRFGEVRVRGIPKEFGIVTSFSCSVQYQGAESAEPLISERILHAKYTQRQRPILLRRSLGWAPGEVVVSSASGMRRQRDRRTVFGVLEARGHSLVICWYSSLSAVAYHQRTRLTSLFLNFQLAIKPSFLSWERIESISLRTRKARRI